MQFGQIGKKLRVWHKKFTHFYVLKWFHFFYHAYVQHLISRVRKKPRVELVIKLVIDMDRIIPFVAFLYFWLKIWNKNIKLGAVLKTASTKDVKKNIVVFGITIVNRELKSLHENQLWVSKTIFFCSGTVHRIAYDYQLLTRICTHFCNTNFFRDLLPSTVRKVNDFQVFFKGWVS